MRVRRGAVLAGGMALVLGVLGLAGCGPDAGKADAGDRQVRLYGTDGNMLNGLGDAFPDQRGILAGMKGTSPLTPLSTEFTTRLKREVPDLADYLYAGETYDAVVISALAAELAGTTDPRTIAKYINGVTTREPGGAECDTVASCLTLARSGVDIQFRGQSLRRGGFTDEGEPAAASYATLHFDESDKIDNGKTEFVGAGDDTATTKLKPPTPAKSGVDSGAPLKIGGLLPLTGNLSFAAPPIVAGAKVAIREINDAGGVLGQPVEWIEGDDGTNNVALATRTLNSQVQKGVHVIIGAAASSMTTAMLPKVVAAGRVLFSPSNTAAELSKADDKGLYFRTAPSDVLQGKALADVILRDGPQRIAIVALKDEYGLGLRENVRAELERAGVPNDHMRLLDYAPPPDEKTPVAGAKGLVESIKDFEADAVLLIGFNESVYIIKALVDGGVEIHH